MRKKTAIFALIVLFMIPAQIRAQFTREEIAERTKWETFLQEADIVKEVRTEEGVTEPWELTLEKDGVVSKAIWKDCQGRMKGYWENWKWEIAAYRLDKFLGLNMVPPTVEKRNKGGTKGSCQLYAGIMDLDEHLKSKVQPAPAQNAALIRAIYLQRAFDNLIYNEDRHQSNYRLTENFRLILIDHSRSFRTTKASMRRLLYDENNKESSKFIMAQLPRSFVDKMRELDADVVRDVVGEYLTDEEIAAVLIRRDLILDWLDKRIAKMGEAGVLY